MPKKNELNGGMEIDSKETFGELIFLRMKSAKAEDDVDTGEKNVNAYRYVVQSSKQLSEEIITVPAENGFREFHYGDKVELINPTANLLGFGGNGNFASSYIQVFAEDIRKASEPASVKVQSDPKNQKDNQQNK
ncbi:DUF961 family protein [Enterococcus faecium]